MQVGIYFVLFVITTELIKLLLTVGCDDTPWLTKDGIYLLFDFVHILKNSSFQVEILFKLQDRVTSWSYIIRKGAIWSSLQANGGKRFPEETTITTITFLGKIISFWKIVNCKWIYADVRSRDLQRAPIRSPDDPRLDYLLEIACAHM